MEHVHSRFAPDSRTSIFSLVSVDVRKRPYHPRWRLFLDERSSILDFFLSSRKKRLRMLLQPGRLRDKKMNLNLVCEPKSSRKNKKRGRNRFKKNEDIELRERYRRREIWRKFQGEIYTLSPATNESLSLSLSLSLRNKGNVLERWNCLEDVSLDSQTRHLRLFEIDDE